jgi:hypothetical protein
MKPRVEWSDLAHATWRTLSPQDAERVALAAVRFAELGEGDVEQVAPDPTLTVRLRVGEFILMLALPHDRLIVSVLWLYRKSAE